MLILKISKRKADYYILSHFAVLNSNSYFRFILIVHKENFNAYDSD